MMEKKKNYIVQPYLWLQFANMFKLNIDLWSFHNTDLTKYGLYLLSDLLIRLIKFPSQFNYGCGLARSEIQPNSKSGWSRPHIISLVQIHDVIPIFLHMIVKNSCATFILSVKNFLLYVIRWQYIKNFYIPNIFISSYKRPDFILS